MKPNREQRALAQKTMNAALKAHLAEQRLDAIPAHYQATWMRGDVSFTVRGAIPGTKGPEMVERTADFTYTAPISRTTWRVGMPYAGEES